MVGLKIVMVSMMIFSSLQVSTGSTDLGHIVNLNNSHSYYFFADGVHPNKRMYAKWSESVGKKLYQRIKPQLEQMKRKHHLVKT